MLLRVGDTVKPYFSKNFEKFTLVGKLSPDKMKLFLDATPVNPPQNISREDLLSALTEFLDAEYVHTGVIDDIAEHLRRGEPALERRISKGVEPEPGTDGKLLFLVKRFTGEREVSLDQRGFANFRELHLFDNIQKGQIVGRLYLPKPGKNGRDVTGRSIPFAPGKALKLNLDPSLSLEASESSFENIRANADGYLAEDGDRLKINAELVIRGDLDFHYGNIDFIGAVKVQGDVMSGLSIRARTGIEISGAVHGGSLTSSDGDIVIKGMITGSPESMVLCGKNFRARVARTLRAEVQGDISIEKEALECSFRTEGILRMEKGSFLGGELLTAGGAEMAQLGNASGQSTRVVLCSDVETRGEFGELMMKIESHERAIQLLELHLGPIAQHPERTQLLKTTHRLKMVQLLKKLEDVRAGRHTLLAKRNRILESARLRDDLRINILKAIHEGVIISAGKSELVVHEDVPGPTSLVFLSAEKKFVFGEMKPLAATVSKESEVKKNAENKLLKEKKG